MSETKIKKELLSELRNNMADYEIYTGKAEEFFDDLSLKGYYSATKPLFHKQKTEFILKYLESKPINLEISKKLLEFLDNRFKKIKEEKKGYHEKVFQELEELTKRYEKTVKEIDSIKSKHEFSKIIELRELCEATLKELEGKKGIKELKERFQKSDSNLKKHINEIIEKWDHLYDNFGGDYYPKTYWWRHLKEFTEKKGKAND